MAFSFCFYLIGHEFKILTQNYFKIQWKMSLHHVRM